MQDKLNQFWQPSHAIHMPLSAEYRSPHFGHVASDSSDSSDDKSVVETLSWMCNAITLPLTSSLLSDLPSLYLQLPFLSLVLIALPPTLSLLSDLLSHVRTCRLSSCTVCLSACFCCLSVRFNSFACIDCFFSSNSFFLLSNSSSSVIQAAVFLRYCLVVVGFGSGSIRILERTSLDDFWPYEMVEEGLG